MKENFIKVFEMDKENLLVKNIDVIMKVVGYED